MYNYYKLAELPNYVPPYFSFVNIFIISEKPKASTCPKKRFRFSYHFLVYKPCPKNNEHLNNYPIWGSRSKVMHVYTFWLFIFIYIVK